MKVLSDTVLTFDEKSFTICKVNAGHWRSWERV